MREFKWWAEWRFLDRFVGPWLARTFPSAFGWLDSRPQWVRDAERRDKEGW